MGTVRFSSMSESLEITTNGLTRKLKEDGTFTFRYYMHPTTVPGATWWWSEDGKDLKLTDGDKKGPTLARISGSLLSVEQGFGFGEAIVDEIVISAVAASRKNGRFKTESEVAGEVIGAVFGA